MITIFQAYDHIPDIFIDCQKSVQKFVNKVGADYVCISSLPERGKKFKFKCTWADLERVEFLSQHKRALWIDFDVMLYDNFKLPTDLAKPCRAGEFIIYNGNDTDFFKKVLEEYKTHCARYSTYTREKFRMYRIFKSLGFIRIPQFDYNTFKHLNYNKMKIKKVT